MQGIDAVAGGIQHQQPLRRGHEPGADQGLQRRDGLGNGVVAGQNAMDAVLMGQHAVKGVRLGNDALPAIGNRHWGGVGGFGPSHVKGQKQQAAQQRKQTLAEHGDTSLGAVQERQKTVYTCTLNGCTHCSTDEIPPSNRWKTP